MSEENRPQPGGEGYERRDIDAGLLLRALAAFVAALALAVFLAEVYYRRNGGERAAGAGSLIAPSEPRLQAHPREDLDRLRAAEDAQLGQYRWIDRRRGRVRIPIARAMELLAERGLPARGGDSRRPR